MKEQQFRSNYGNSAIILFIVFSLILGLTAYYEQELHLYLLYPFFFFLIPFVYYSFTNYGITNTQFLLNEPFNKKRVALKDICVVEIKQYKKRIRFLYGQPKIYVLVKYNRYDEMHIYPKFPENFREALFQKLEVGKEVNS